MKQKLLIGVAFCGTVIWGVGNVEAACTPTPSCTELGYTKTQSECGDSGIKCPFGNLWSCSNSCEKSGFIYTCTGINESPNGPKCGNKYSMCNCAMGFNWENGECKEDSCKIGYIYYANGICSADIFSGETALGVVVYLDESGEHGQLMSAWPVDENGNKSNGIVDMKWSNGYIDILSLPDYRSYSSAAHDFDSCSNTDKILANTQITYPAARAARLYAPTNETKGKWCLPAAGVMNSIYNNQSAIRAGMSKLDGVTYFDCCMWSSSEYNTSYAWRSYFSNANGLYYYDKVYSNYVRPVMEF